MSLIARHLEAQGIPTLSVGSALDILKAGRPPRSVFVDYPLGHSVGVPFDRENQFGVIKDALSAFETLTEPGAIESLPYVWPDGEDWRSDASDTRGSDTRSPRDTTPVYQTESDRVAAENRASAVS